MQGSLQNKLLQHEVVPPPSAWEKISRQLDEEFISDDASLSSRVENASITPPPHVWNSIATSLQTDDNVKIIPSAKVVKMNYGRRIAVAAMVIGIIAFASLYLFQGNTYNSLPRQTASDEIVNNIPEQREPSSDPAPSTKLPESDSGRLPDKTVIASLNTQHRPSSKTVARSAYETSAYQAINESDQEPDPKPIQMMATLQQPVSVAAPPIRDARGNVIMDMSVISNPNDHYIVVTSPNGNQTKISNKFLHCLSYLNGDYSSSEINTEGIQWKSRFEEWRNKLLSEATFIPAANNFFDIFELKELIEERN